MMQPFHFHTKLDQTLLLGIQARNAADLLAGIRQVPAGSIYHHTHRFLQRHHYLSPEPPNDFAYWMTAMINDDALGEQLASIDVIQFRTIPQLRDAFIAVLENALNSAEKVRDCIRGEEFQFMATRTFVLETPLIAHNLTEFRDMLGTVSIKSLYYHMFDARLRLAQGENDFSLWFHDLGYAALGDAVSRLDPYNCTLEGLRNDIITLVDSHDLH
jgi:hypothetical protein